MISHPRVAAVDNGCVRLTAIRPSGRRPVLVHKRVCTPLDRDDARCSPLARASGSRKFARSCPFSYSRRARTPEDATLLVHAVVCGLLPEIKRRLGKAEQRQIRSGDVFVWQERTADPKDRLERWTDGAWLLLVAAAGS